MDSERFDRLVRSFGQTRTRRQTLRGLAGAVAVGAFAVGGREASADLCKNTGKPCKRNGQCCSENCVGGGGGARKEGTCQAQATTCVGWFGPCPSGCTANTPCNDCCTDPAGTVGGGYCYGNCLDGGAPCC